MPDCTTFKSRGAPSSLAVAVLATTAAAPADADADAEAEAIAAAADSVDDAVEPEAAQLYLYYWGGIVTVSGGGI